MNINVIINDTNANAIINEVIIVSINVIINSANVDVIIVSINVIINDVNIENY